jgi:hypothetical protein
MSNVDINLQTDKGARLLANFLDAQISLLIQSVGKISASPLPRVARLYALYSAIIEDAISIRLLGDVARLNQAYIISRALLERLTNFCFLQLCKDEEFGDYIDYTLNKIGRRVDRNSEAYGVQKARVALQGGDFELPPEITAAVAKFTSERGREKTRWTTVSLPDRAAVIEAKLGNTGLFMSFLTVYADASEALHGTLYGAAFHLGAYDPGAVPHDQDSLDRHRYETLSCIYLMAGGSIDTMLSLLAAIDEPNFLQSAKASQVAFKRAAIQTGLAATKAQPNQSMQPIATGCSCG